jgi:3-oxoadipate enol-lactonase
MWDPQWDPLIARHRTLRLELPGFGHSPLERARVSSAGKNRDMLDAVGSRRSGIVDASLGGPVALELAVTRCRQ